MAPLYRPGTYIQEQQSATSIAGAAPQVSATPVFVGAHSQGPIVPTLVTSWSQFLKIFGGFGDSTPTYLSLAVYTFFTNGGGQCLVIRVVDTSAIAATLALKDSGANTTITVNAANPGAWGNNISVQVTPASNGSSTSFNLNVYYGTSVVEQWPNLAMSQSSPQYFVAIVNNTLTGSSYISLVDVEGTSTSSGNAPATITKTSLASGADGTAPTDSEIIAALPLLDPYPGPLTLNIPNADNSVIGGAISYSQNRAIAEDTFVVIDAPAASSSTELSSAYAAGLTGVPDGSEGTAGSGGLVQGLGATDCAAIYTPWLLISDPTSTVAGATRYVPPGGAVMGVIARTDTQYGPWQAPAGVSTGGLGGVVGLQFAFTPADLDNLNYANVNAIKIVPGYGPTVFGARTLSQISGKQYVNVRRLLSYIEVYIAQLLQSVIFDDNDASLWQLVTTQVDGFLATLYAAGAFTGASSADAYYVTCDSTVNTPQVVAAGQLICVVGVAPVTPAEFIVVQVSQWASGSTTASTS